MTSFDRATDSSSAVPFTWSGFRAGAIAMSPLFPSQIAFAIVFGVLAAQKALTSVEATIMSALVFAGLAQAAAMEIWSQHFTTATLAAVSLATFTINSRLILMGMTYRPWFGTLPAWKTYPMLLLMTDPGWLLAMRYYQQGGRDVGFMLGGSLVAYPIWVLWTWIGHEAASWIANPKQWGLDILVPVLFGAMLIPLWRGRLKALPWVVAGIVALLVQQFGLDRWYVVAGAVCGAITAGALGDD